MLCRRAPMPRDNIRLYRRGWPCGNGRLHRRRSLHHRMGRGTDRRCNCLCTRIDCRERSNRGRADDSQTDQRGHREFGSGQPMILFVALLAIPAAVVLTAIISWRLLEASPWRWIIVGTVDVAAALAMAAAIVSDGSS